MICCLIFTWSEMLLNVQCFTRYGEITFQLRISDLCVAKTWEIADFRIRTWVYSLETQVLIRKSAISRDFTTHSSDIRNENVISPYLVKHCTFEHISDQVKIRRHTMIDCDYVERCNRKRKLVQPPVAVLSSQLLFLSSQLEWRDCWLDEEKSPHWSQSVHHTNIITDLHPQTDKKRVPNINIFIINLSWRSLFVRPWLACSTVMSIHVVRGESSGCGDRPARKPSINIVSPPKPPNGRTIKSSWARKQ